MRRLAAVAATALILLAAPATASAHSLVGLVESPLPLAVYLTGAALAVALSFTFLIVRDVRAPAPGRERMATVPRAVVTGLRAVGLLGWCWIVAQVIVGGSSDANVATLFLWVYGWVGVAALSAFVGPVWTWLDPFSTLYDLGAAALRRLGVRPWKAAPTPPGSGSGRPWPASRSSSGSSSSTAAARASCSSPTRS